MASKGSKGGGNGLISGFMRRVSQYSSKVLIPTSIPLCSEKGAPNTVREEDEGEEDSDSGDNGGLGLTIDIPEEFSDHDNVEDGATPVGSPRTSRDAASAEDGSLDFNTPVRPRTPNLRANSGHARSVSDVAMVSIDRESIPESLSGADSSESGSEGRASAENFPFAEGTLSKWTNYINGWQDRHVVIREGTLSYYRAANEADICRAAIDLAVASVQKHKFDQFRFDVRFGDQCFYFRATTEADKDRWVATALETQSRLVDGRSSYLHRSSSMASLASATSVGSGSIRTSAFQEKLTEVMTFHGLLTSLIDKVQAAMPSESNGEGATARGSQFRADCLMFKSTSSGMMQAVEDCVSMANRREEEWRKRLVKANDKRKHFEQLYQQSMATMSKQRDTSGPDMQEGPHSQLTEEEWFDAIAEADAQRGSVDISDEDAPVQSQSPSTPKEPEKDSKWQEIVSELMTSCRRLKEDTGLEWEEVLEDQNIKVYRCAVIEADEREHEKSRVTGTFPAVTASELIEYYENPDVKQLWDSTMETLKIIEQDRNCALPWSIEYYTYRRVWPAAQRESVVILHTEKLGHEEYISVTRTVKHDAVPEAGGRIQVKAQVALFVKTVFREGATPPYTRDDVATAVEYFTDVDPGGWAPSSVVSAVARREIPKTLRALSKGAKKWFEKHPLPANLAQ